MPDCLNCIQLRVRLERSKEEVARLRELVDILPAKVMPAIHRALCNVEYDEQPCNEARCSTLCPDHADFADHTEAIVAVIRAALSQPAPASDKCECPPPTFTVRTVRGPNSGTEICTRCGKPAPKEAAHG